MMRVGVTVPEKCRETKIFNLDSLLSVRNITLAVKKVLV